MKVLFSFFITISLITGINLLANKQANIKRTDPSPRLKINISKDKKPEEKLKTFAASARDCFLADMSLSSGQPRFFIYYLGKDSVLQSGLVAHGNCYQDWLEGRKYSNKVGSGCTSLGRYRIGNPYTGMWGYSYKLHGLDSSNNNAFERTVVLHGHRCVPSEVVKEEICQSNGCPTVAPDFLLRLKQLINTSAKPVLLWIYQ